MDLLPTGYTVRELLPVPGDLAALAELHASVLAPAFPDPDELETASGMAACLSAGTSGPDSYRVMAAFARGVPVGACVTDLLGGTGACMVEYLAVSPAHGRKGLGRAMLDATLDVFRAREAACGGEASFMLAEAHDPALHGERPDSMDPAARIAILARYGFRRLRVRYVQPALRPGCNPCRTLALLARTSDPSAGSIPSGELSAALGRFLAYGLGIGDPRGHPDMAATWDFLDHAGNGVALADPLGAGVT